MEPAFAAILRPVATILLVVHMILGLFVWFEDHADNRLRVIRLGLVLFLALILLFIIYMTGQHQP